MEINPYFYTRCTVRAFDTEKNIGDTELEQLVAAASQAPNTGNMQLYSVVATRRGSDLHRRLAELHYNQPSAANAPVLLTVCADTRRFSQWCRHRNAESGLDNFGGRLTAVVDASIFAQQLVTIAEMSGLGCCYLGTATYNAPDFARELGLPEGVIPVVGLALGWPADDAKNAVSDRLPVEAVLHRERFSDYSAGDIDSFYHRKENMPESKAFIAENGLDTLAQVYSQVRYPKALNENLGNVMLKMME